jgi:hypothetical protein
MLCCETVNNPGLLRFRHGIDARGRAERPPSIPDVHTPDIKLWFGR